MSTGDSGFGLLLEPLMAKNAATSAVKKKLPRFVFISLLTPSRINHGNSEKDLCRDSIELPGFFPELIFNIVRRAEHVPKKESKIKQKVNKCT